MGHSSCLLCGVNGGSQTLGFGFPICEMGCLSLPHRLLQRQKRNEASKHPAALGGGEFWLWACPPGTKDLRHGGALWAGGQSPADESGGVLLPFRGGLLAQERSLLRKTVLGPHPEKMAPELPDFAHQHYNLGGRTAKINITYLVSER